MKNFTESEKSALRAEYTALKSRGLKLDMSRGKPSPEQINLARGMLTCLNEDDFKAEDGTDCRNYGEPYGLPEAKRLFADMLCLKEEQIIVGGNSSLQLMHDTIARAMLKGTVDSVRPWCKEENVKFVCLVPGYDRHFAICEFFGIEMLSVPFDDIKTAEKFISYDSGVKGMWCVPMYSNPEGRTLSDDAVRRIAEIKPAAPDFRIFWDNAYCVHHLTDTPDTLLNIAEECEKAGNPNMVYEFASMSKISFGGAGISAIGGSKANIDFIKKQIGIQTIGSDKMSQLRHARFFKDFEGIKKHMEKHRELLQPKFDIVAEKLAPLLELGMCRFYKPDGGYFLSYHGLKGTAKRTVQLCKEAGVVLTGAGAAFPYGVDPDDENIRIAPTYPSREELSAAMDVFVVSAKIAAAETFQ